MDFLRPNADDVDGLWLNESGSNTNLYASLDETVAGDTDYIVSPDNPSNAVCRIALSNPTGGALAAPFVLRYRFNNSGGATLKVRLVQGASTEIASWTESGSGWTTSAQTLTAPQLALITDFTDLFVEFTASSGDPTLVLDLDFTAGTLDSKVTFTRSTTATRVNSSGVIVSAAIDAPRFDYDPTTLAARGLLIEEQRTNMFTYSADFGNPPGTLWVKGSGVTLGGLVAAPDGTTTGQTVNIANTSSDGLFFSFVGGITAGATYTISVWAKSSASGGATHLQMTTNNRFAWNTGISQQFPLTSQWQRFVITGAISTGTEANVSLHDARNAAGTGQSVAVGNVDLWGAQCELAPFASSYIPTTTAGVTRAADVASMTGTNFSSWYNASEGTFLLELVDTGTAGVGGPHFININNSASPGNDRIGVYNPASIQVWDFIQAGGTMTKNDLTGTVNATTGAAKIALAVKANDAASSINGAAAVADASVTVPTVNRLFLGADETGAASKVHQTYYRRLRYYNVRKTNAELAALTT